MGQKAAKSFLKTTFRNRVDQLAIAEHPSCVWMLWWRKGFQKISNMFFDIISKPTKLWFGKTYNCVENLNISKYNLKPIFVKGRAIHPSKSACHHQTDADNARQKWMSNWRTTPGLFQSLTLEECGFQVWLGAPLGSRRLTRGKLLFRLAARAPPRKKTGKV